MTVPLIVLLVHFCVSLSIMNLLMLKFNNSYDSAFIKIAFYDTSICKYRKSENKVSFPCPFLTTDVGQE